MGVVSPDARSRRQMANPSSPVIMKVENDGIRRVSRQLPIESAATVHRAGVESRVRSGTGRSSARSFGIIVDHDHSVGLTLMPSILSRLRSHGQRQGIAKMLRGRHRLTSFDTDCRSI